ncbi:MAG TPA: hypothetical protein VF614_11960 [Chthoniobacteraceae bacterium]|jgi:hypothetical protein
MTSLLLQTTRLSLLIGIAAGQTLHAQDVEQAVTNGTKATETVVKSAEAVRTHLGLIRTDTELNRLEKPELAPLDTLSSTLGETRETHLTPLVASLQNAVAAPDDAARRYALVDTFTRQKALELALKDASNAFSPGEAQTRLLRHIATLLNRQMTNVRMTSAIEGIADAPSELVGADQRRHAVTGVEQAALEAEIGLLARAVSVTPPDLETGPTATALAVRTGLSRTSLLSSAQLAKETTRSGPLTTAVFQQKTVEKKLSELLDSALAAEPRRETGKVALAFLKQITADEKALRDATDGKLTDDLTLAERQGRLEDRTEVLNRLLQKLHPAAAQRISDASKKMDEAARCLNPGGNGPGAVPAENAAIALLEQATSMCEGAGMGEGAGKGQGKGEGEGQGQGNGQGEGEGQGANGNGLAGDEEGDEGEGEEGENGGGKGPGAGLAGSEGEKPSDKGTSEQLPDGENLLPASALVIGNLVRKEREALSATEADKPLPQYAPLVEQYLRSLSAPAPNDKKTP